MNYSGDERNHAELVKKKLVEFFAACENSDKIMIYSCLDTDFQRAVPLNYFLLHSRYDWYPGSFMGIVAVEIHKDVNRAAVKVLADTGGEKPETLNISLKMDFGGWKIDGESIFDR